MIADAMCLQDILLEELLCHNGPPTVSREKPFGLQIFFFYQSFVTVSGKVTKAQSVLQAKGREFQTKAKPPG